MDDRSSSTGRKNGCRLLHSTLQASMSPSDLSGREMMALYKTVDHDSFMRLFFSAKLEGKSFLQRWKKMS
jgi:hypothetical protein